MIERYFDNAASTPLDPRVLEEMLPFLEHEFGNANSIHSFGLRAMAAVEKARERVAGLIGAEDSSQVTFTCGATEANNWVLQSNVERDMSWVSPFEHSAVYEPAIALGYRVLENDGLEILPPEETARFMSVMSVNNEIGARWDLRGLLALADTIHSDITQQVGKLPVDLEGIDYASMSAHKLYGPKGIGALYSASAPPMPLIMGGEQEMGSRAGTLNVPGIVGFGAAAAIAMEEMEENLLKTENLRAIVLDRLQLTSDFIVNGGDDASPYILSVSFLGVEGETLVIEADQAGYAISGGAACSSRATEPSHVLTALGMEPEWLRGTVRISFGRFNSEESAEGLAQMMLTTVEKLRRMR